MNPFMVIVGIIYFGGMYVYLKQPQSRPGCVFWAMHPIIAVSIVLYMFVPMSELQREKELTIQQQEQEERRKESDEFKQQLLNISKDPKTLNKIDENAEENDNSGKF